MMTCPFCNMDYSKVENTILDETDNFYVLPAVGSLVDGYVLIVSKRHINSMAELNTDEMIEYEKIIKKFRKILKYIYKKSPIIFEHGSPIIEDKVKANSVSHAHTHIINHYYRNEKHLIRKMNFKRINKISDVGKSKNYILYINSQNKIYVTTVFKPISQIMRIKIAKDQGKIWHYDWKTYRFDDNIISTIDKIKKEK